MMDQSATETAQDVVDAALSLLEQGADFSHLEDLPGLEEVGEDDDGRTYHAFRSGVPVLIDCDEDGARIQWTGTSADDCFDEFMMLFSAFDPDARRGVSQDSGTYAGRVAIGGSEFTYLLYDDEVSVGPDGDLQEGTILTLADSESEWVGSPYESRRAFG